MKNKYDTWCISELDVFFIRFIFKKLKIARATLVQVKLKDEDKSKNSFKYEYLIKL